MQLKNQASSFALLLAEKGKAKLTAQLFKRIKYAVIKAKLEN